MSKRTELETRMIGVLRDIQDHIFNEYTGVYEGSPKPRIIHWDEFGVTNKLKQILEELNGGTK